MACAEPARRQAPYGDDGAEPLPAAPSNCPAVASLRGTATMPPRSREVWQSGADVGRVWWVQVTVHGASRLADFLVDWNAFRAAARRPIAPGHPVCPPSAPASPAPHPSRAAARGPGAGGVSRAISLDWPGPRRDRGHCWRHAYSRIATHQAERRQPGPGPGLVLESEFTARIRPLIELYQSAAAGKLIRPFQNKQLNFQTGI